MKTIRLSCESSSVVDVSYVVGSVQELARENGVEIITHAVTADTAGLNKIYINLSVEGLDCAIQSFESDLKADLRAEQVRLDAFSC